MKDSGSEGMRLTEAQAINKSLSNLGNVIMALAQKVGSFNVRRSNCNYNLAELACAIPQLQADPSPPELPRRQQQDLDVCQHLSQGGVLRRNFELFEVNNMLPI